MSLPSLKASMLITGVSSCEFDCYVAGDWHMHCSPQDVAKSKRIRILLLCLWLLSVGIGAAVLLRYERTSGQVAGTPQQWPEQAPLSLDPSRSTLVMFAHPYCPCTRASINELNRLLVKCGKRLAVHVAFLRPSQFGADWTRTASWRSAEAIPGVAVHEDLDGRQAKRFGALTSGYVVLYDPQGRLIFKGGITRGRGHAGDNAGADAILKASLATAKIVDEMPVYGCSLFSSGQCHSMRGNLCEK